MDVGAPSNFERMAAHFSWEEMRRLVIGRAVTDDETRAAVREVFSRWAYYLDPHSAVGWKAVDKLSSGKDGPFIVLSTAHPAKFAETVEPLAGAVPVPPSLRRAMERTAEARTIAADLDALKECL
jgi:threonine synthase